MNHRGEHSTSTTPQGRTKPSFQAYKHSSGYPSCATYRVHPPNQPLIPLSLAEKRTCKKKKSDLRICKAQASLPPPRPPSQIVCPPTRPWQSLFLHRFVLALCCLGYPTSSPVTRQEQLPLCTLMCYWGGLVGMVCFARRLVSSAGSGLGLGCG